jgi:hypothetical protein
MNFDFRYLHSRVSPRAQVLTDHCSRLSLLHAARMPHFVSNVHLSQQ